MLKDISCSVGIHKNRNMEFYNGIIGKYLVTGSALSLLPKLVYLETAHVFSCMANNHPFISKGLKLQNINYRKVNFTTSNYGVKVFNTNNYGVKVFKIYNSTDNNRTDYAGIIAASLPSVRNKKHRLHESGIHIGSERIGISAPADSRLHYSLQGSIIRINRFGTDKLANSRNDVPVSIRKNIQNVYFGNKNISYMNRGAVETKIQNFYRNLGSENLYSPVKNNSEGWNIKNVYGPRRENNAYNYSAVFREDSISAKTGNMLMQSPDLELVKHEPVMTQSKKHETTSQDVVSDGTKGTVTQTPLDINRIVSRVYNEIERKIRIERERRGF